MAPSGWMEWDQLGQPCHRHVRIHMARWRKAAEQRRHHGSRVQEASAREPVSCGGGLGPTSQGVYLPMIKTHSGPPCCRPGGDTATSLLPCVGPRSPGSALPSPAQARLSAPCSTAAPLRCFVDDFATSSSLRSLRLESLGECLSLSSHHDDSHARSKYSAICR